SHASGKWRHARGGCLRDCNGSVGRQRTRRNDDLAAAGFCDRATRRADACVDGRWRRRRIVATAATAVITAPTPTTRRRYREHRDENCPLAVVEERHGPPAGNSPLCLELRRLRRIADTH